MRNVLLIIVLLVIVGAIYYLQPKPAPAPIATTKISPKPKTDFDFKYELQNPSSFINTPPFKIADLIGKKIILVDFWTYSCINCQRTTPYLNAWYQKYRDKGLEIVGVHSPEFEFEKDINNVKQAVANEQIKFPVVLDNEMATWNAYGNRYWPRRYLINLQGEIVYDHIGEGAYEETEMKIKELLGDLNQNITKPIAATLPSAGISQETYFGSNRNGNFATGAKLSGDWNIQPEFAENKSAGDKINFPYRAKRVFFVASADAPVEIEIKQDGQVVKTLTVKDAKLYTLIENAAVELHQLEIIIKSPGLRAYTFTFG